MLLPGTFVVVYGKEKAALETPIIAVHAFCIVGVAGIGVA